VGYGRVLTDGAKAGASKMESCEVCVDQGEWQLCHVFIQKRFSKFFISLGCYVTKRLCRMYTGCGTGCGRLKEFNSLLCLVRWLITCNREACVWHNASNVGQVGLGL